MAAKRVVNVEGSGGNSSPVIRNLVATPDSKSGKFGSPNVKGGAPAGPRFSNVVEQHEEEEEEE